MIISKLIKKPISVLILFLIAIGFGIYVTFNLPIELIPNIEIPTVSIITKYQNTNAEEIEETITKPIEQALQSLKNVKEISSISLENQSAVTVEFEYGTSNSDNINNLREALDQAKNFLPINAKSPIVFQFNPSMIPVLALSISGNRTVNDIQKITEDVLLPYFEQIDGIANTKILGGEVQKVFVNVDLYKIKSFGITTTDVKNAISLNSKRTSLGTIDTDSLSIALLLNTKFTDINQVKNVVVKSIENANGTTSYIRVKDVAEVYKGFKKESEQYIYVNEKPSITVLIRKQNDKSIVEVSDNIIASLEQIKEIAPVDFSFDIIADNSLMIRNNIKTIIGAIISGAFLAVIILLIFLRNIAAVMVISITIPASIVLTLMLMYFFDMSLNVFTLAGLALGIGMLVDNSIVVLENIYAKRMSGLRLLSASEYGSTEMMRPILTSTLTTISVFLPMIIFKKELGVIGSLFANLSFTVVMSIIASFLIAAFVLPVITSTYIKIHPLKHTGTLKKFDKKFENTLASTLDVYKNILSYMLSRRKRFIALILLISLLPLALMPIFKFQFNPDVKKDNLQVNFTFPSGTNPKYMRDIMRELNVKIKSFIPDIKYTLLSSSSNKGGANSNPIVRDNGYTAAPGKGKITYILTKSKSTSDLQKTIEKINTIASQYIGIEYSVHISDNRASGNSVFSGSKFILKVKSDNYNNLLETVETYKRVLEKNPKLSRVRDDQANRIPEYTFNIDTVKANLDNLTVNTIATELKNSIAGSTASRFTEGAKERDIYVQLSDKYRKDTTIIDQIDVRNKKGVLLPVSNYVSKKQSLGISQISRQGYQRTIQITADIIPGESVTKVISEIKTTLRGIPKDDNLTYIFDGSYKDLQKNFSLMLQIFLIAVVFVFGIMASQFESLLDPFIIIFTIPLTLFGVLIVYAIVGLPITSFTMVGLVVLVGVAVNHGIVLIDYINLLIKRGESLTDAILHAATSRFTPIMITTLTTVFGLFPIALFDLDGTELIRPIALTIVGGLSSSALLSLLLSPLIYYSFNKKKNKKRLIQINSI